MEQSRTRGWTERPQIEDYVAFLIEGGAEWHKTCGQQAVILVDNEVWKGAPKRLHYCTFCCMSIHPEYAKAVVNVDPWS